MRRAPQSQPPSKASGFAKLAFEQFRVGLQRFLLRRLRNRDNAEDLAQEVYLRLLRFANAELVERPAAYVYQVAYNVLCEFKLNEQKGVVSFDSDAAAQMEEGIAADLPSPEAALEQSAREQRLDAVLAGLPPMQRAVFLLAIRHELPHAQIAQKLGISLHTVRKYLYRALQHCRQRLPEAYKEVP